MVLSGSDAERNVMATTNGTVKTPRGNGSDRPVTDIDGTTGQVTNAASDIPVDDGPSDDRAQLTKLSLAQMGVQPERSLKKKRKVIIDGREAEVEAGEDVLQATIYGQITGLTGPKELPNAKPGADAITYGLIGRIEGVNNLTGEMFKAGVLYLPAGFHDMFLTEVESQLKIGDGHVALAFALEFWSIPATNPRGYSWKAKNKLAMERTDPLRGIRARALAGTTVAALPPTTTKQLIA